MANVLLFHYRESKTAKPLIKALKAEGHQVFDAAPDYPDFQSSVEVADPELVVVDCSYKFQHGLEAADYVRNLKAYHGIPVLLVHLEERNHGFAASKLADAVLVADQGKLVEAVEDALGAG